MVQTAIPCVACRDSGKLLFSASHYVGEAAHWCAFVVSFNRKLSRRFSAEFNNRHATSMSNSTRYFRCHNIQGILNYPALRRRHTGHGGCSDSEAVARIGTADGLLTNHGRRGRERPGEAD